MPPCSKVIGRHSSAPTLDHEEEANTLIGSKQNLVLVTRVCTQNLTLHVINKSSDLILCGRIGMWLAFKGGVALRSNNHLRFLVLIYITFTHVLILKLIN